MEIRPIPNVSSLAYPLPLYASIPIATAIGKDGERFIIRVGFDEMLAEQIKNLSMNENDSELVKNTSDRERFGIGSYETWYRKGRTPFALVHEDSGTLAAVAWFGPKPLGRKSLKHLSPEERTQNESLIDPGNWHTIVYRSYVPFRGKGLMKNFVRFALDTYLEGYPGAHVWEIMDANNAGSIALAKSLGLEQKGDVTEGSIVMVRE